MYSRTTASSLAAIKTALITACVAAGWENSGNNLSLDAAGLSFDCAVDGNYLTFFANPAGASTNSDIVSIGRLGVTSAGDITFPATLDIYAFDTELYLVVNYSADKYQFFACGKSQVIDLPGCGMWLGATCGNPAAIAAEPIYLNATEGAHTAEQVTSAALFYSTSGDMAMKRNSWVHHDYDDNGWWHHTAIDSQPCGIRYCSQLNSILPGVYPVLLPIRCYVRRGLLADYAVSLAVELQYARQLRIDHYTPGDILRIGNQRFAVYPWHQRNTVNRNALPDRTHTGTFGWAILREVL